MQPIKGIKRSQGLFTELKKIPFFPTNSSIFSKNSFVPERIFLKGKSQKF